LRVIVDGWAWLPKKELSALQIQGLRASLTIQPKKVGDHPGDPPGPLYLFSDSEEWFGVPREFFRTKKRSTHEVESRLTLGNKALWPGPLKFSPKETLRAEQQQALDAFISALTGDRYGGILQAPPGWGKTAWSCALMAALEVPVLVVVHKEFLMTQWRERIQRFLPGARIGKVQEDELDFEGKHIVLGMVHTLCNKQFSPIFIGWPGLVLTDECHRIGAATWSLVPPKFPAKYRVGLSATPRRKDGAEAVFLNHLGEVLFRAKEQRLRPKVRIVTTKFRLPQGATFNPGLIPKSLLLQFMCGNRGRNALIAEQLVLAAKAGRKVLVLSERLQHLGDLEEEFKATWGMQASGDNPSIGYFVGGTTEEEQKFAEKCQVIFATSQFVQEGLDIPALDTLFLTTPLSDIEQAVGRILRPFDGKKDPVVVDFRDDNVSSCKRYARSRDRYYEAVAA
jgi:superfamily II DNA or RNA helicase